MLINSVSDLIRHDLDAALADAERPDPSWYDQDQPDDDLDCYTYLPRGNPWRPRDRRFTIRRPAFPGRAIRADVIDAEAFRTELAQVWRGELRDWFLEQIQSDAAKGNQVVAAQMLDGALSIDFQVGLIP